MTRPQYRPLVLVATATAVAACASPGIDVNPVLEINGDRIDVDVSGNHERGLAHMQAGRLGRALQEFRQALRETPGNIETLNAIAVAYDLMSRFEMAHHYYERALAINPNSFQTLNNLGRSYLAKGGVQMASKYLERARSIDPSAPQLQDNLELLLAMEHRQPRQAADTTVLATTPAENTWIERTSAVEQTLVTTASPEAIKALSALNVDPRTVSFKADLGHVRSEPIESNGSMESLSATPLPENPARPEASALDSSENMQLDKRFERRVVADDEITAAASAATPEPVLVDTSNLEPGVGHEQPNTIHAEFAAESRHPIFVGRSPRAMGLEAGLSNTVAKTLPSTAPEPDLSLSMRLNMAAAQFQDSQYGMMSVAVDVSKVTESATILAKFEPRNFVVKATISPLPLTTATPTKRPSQRIRRRPEANGGLSTRALNTCSLNRMKAGAPTNAATAMPAAMALTEVSNGVGRYRMAARMGRYLSVQGFCLSRTSDAAILGQSVSKIFYSSGFEKQAKLIAEALPSDIPMQKDETLSSDIRLVLGTDLLGFDSLLEKGI